MKINRYTVINTGDILLINFGKSTVTSHTKGVHPAYVVSIDDSRSLSAHMMVIPMFKHPSYQGNESSIAIKRAICSGLRYDEYMLPTNLQKIERRRAISKIGHIPTDKQDEITQAIITGISLSVNKYCTKGGKDG